MTSTLKIVQTNSFIALIINRNSKLIISTINTNEEDSKVEHKSISVKNLKSDELQKKIDEIIVALTI